jgi:Spy/CpxP family protein refolding chaperone
MKPMNKKIPAIALSALLATATAGAFAFGGQQDRRDHCDHRGHSDHSGMNAPMAALNRLDGLTDEQKSSLTQIRRDTRDAMRDLRNEMQHNRDALKDAMADKQSIGDIRTLATKQGEIVAKMIVLRAETREKIDSVLTDEQRAQLKTMPRHGGDFGRFHDRSRF